MLVVAALCLCLVQSVSLVCWSAAELLQHYHIAADLAPNNMAPYGTSTKSCPPGISKSVFRRMVKANQFLHGDEDVPSTPCRTKHYKGTQLAFDIGKAVVLKAPYHVCCKHRRLCFDGKGHQLNSQNHLKRNVSSKVLESGVLYMSLEYK